MPVYTSILALMEAKIIEGFNNVWNDYSTAILALLGLFLIIMGIDVISRLLWKASAPDKAEQLFNESQSEKGARRDYARIRYRRHLKRMEDEGMFDD